MKKLAILALLVVISFFNFTKSENEQPQLSKEKKVAIISKEIKEGKIDVGEEYGMEIGQRWHNIHSEILEMKCSECHKVKFPNDYIYQRRYKVPVRDAPGVVMRELCIECHSKKGAAITKLYGS